MVLTEPCTECDFFFHLSTTNDHSVRRSFATTRILTVSIIANEAHTPDTTYCDIYYSDAGKFTATAFRRNFEKKNIPHGTTIIIMTRH